MSSEALLQIYYYSVVAGLVAIMTTSVVFVVSWLVTTMFGVKPNGAWCKAKRWVYTLAFAVILLAVINIVGIEVYNHSHPL